MPKPSPVKVTRPSIQDLKRKAKSALPVVSIIAFASTAVGLLATSLSNLGRTSDMNNQIISDLQAGESLEIAGTEYYLNGPEQIKYEHYDTSYIVNFDTGMITIDGPDGADSVIAIRDYPEPSFIKDVFQNGVTLANNFHPLMDELITEDERAWMRANPSSNASFWFNKLGARATVFAAKYGPDADNNPYKDLLEIDTETEPQESDHAAEPDNEADNQSVEDETSLPFNMVNAYENSITENIEIQAEGDAFAAPIPKQPKAGG